MQFRSSKSDIFAHAWLHRLIQVSTLLALGATFYFVTNLNNEMFGVELNNDVIDRDRSGLNEIQQPRSNIPHVHRPGFMQMSKVVVFSLYGDRGMDRDGALANAISVPLYYLSWKPVFIVDETISTQFQDQLRDLGATVIQLSANYSNWGNAKRIMRFLILADPTVQYAMFRDADSRISTREMSSVNTWLNSDKTFHIMRDHPNHWFVLPGGMWSVHVDALRSRIDDIGKNITDYVTSRLPDPAWDTDQNWLEDVIWPLIGDDVIDHDSFHCGEHGNHSTPFPLPREYHGEYVGLVQDTTATEILTNNHIAVWPEYRRHGAANFWTTSPDQCRLQPYHIYG